MAERNDVNIKVGVTGAKKALDELTKVLDSYSKKEKAQQQLAHQAEVNQLKLKELNSERLHKGRVLKEAERIKQVLNNAKIESAQLTNRLNMIKQTAATETALADQAAKSHKAKNSQIQSDLSLQHATQRAILATTTATAEATGRQEVATLRVAKAQNDVLRTEERAGAATNSRIASEVRLQSTKEKTASQSQQNILREQNLAERLNNTRLIGINKIASEERRETKFTLDEERRQRKEIQDQRLADIRAANAAERMEMSRTRFAQQQQDRETRRASQHGGFFGQVLGPDVGRAVEALGRLNLAFMVVTNSLRPFTEAIQFSIQSFARYESATVGFNLQLMNMGRNISEGNRIVQQFNDGISDPTAVMRAVQLMAPMNLSYQKQIDLINAIRDGVVSMGGDVNEQLPLMVLAVRRGSSELLDNMGVTKNAEEVYKEFAKTIGKKVSELKEEEKQTALVNAVIQENTKVSGFARQSADTLDGSMQRLSTSARTLGTNIGSYLAPGVREAIDLFERMAAAAARALPRQESDIEMLRRQYPTKESARAALTSAQQMVTGTQARLNATRQTFERRERELFPNNPAARSFNIIQNQLREEIRGLEAGLQIATNTRNQVGRLMMEYINTEQAANRQAFEKAGPLIKPTPVADDKTKKGKMPRAARAPRVVTPPKPVIQGPDLSGALRRKEAERIQREESERLKNNYIEWQKAEDKKAKLRSEQLEDDYREWQRIQDEKEEAEKKRIQDTADFLESSYQVALQVLQGDFTAVFSVIGNSLKDSFIKTLSETEAVKGFVGSITAGFTAMAGQIAAALTGALTAAFTAIGAILTGPFAPLIIAVGALGVLIAKTMGDASERAKKYAEDIKNLKDGIDKLLPKAPQATIREQRQQKIGELETRRGQLLARLEKERKGTYFATRGGGYTQVDKGAIAGFENELGIVEQGIKDLGDALRNDLDDPLSDAAKAAKSVADAIELMTKRSESFVNVARLNDDLQDKIFNQTIDRLVQEGKITKEEGEKRKLTQEIVRERSDLVSKAYEESRGFMFGGGIGMSKGTFDAAFGKFRQGDMAGASAMLATIGVTENETQHVIQLFKNIEEYLTGKGASVNMPGSSPDKPMYTQVVNVRDFREAFPDSAYFRAPSVDTTRSLNANAVAYR